MTDYDLMVAAFLAGGSFVLFAAALGIVVWSALRKPPTELDERLAAVDDDITKAEVVRFGSRRRDSGTGDA